MDKTTIDVSGESTVEMAIDRVKLTLQLKSVKREYRDASLSLHNQTHRIKEALVSCGVKRDDILTEEFKVAQAHEYDSQTKTSVLIGYQASHSLTFSVAFSRPYLGDLLRAIGKANVEAEISMEFWATDEEKYLLTLIRQAYEQAQQTALALAQASGYRLGKPVSIKTDDRILRRRESFVYDSMSLYAMKAIRLMPDPDIQPQNTVLTCEVKVSWLLEMPENECVPA